MSSEYTLFDDGEWEIYVSTKITKEGVIHQIIDTCEGTNLTTEQLKGVVENLQDLLKIYEEEG